MAELQTEQAGRPPEKTGPLTLAARRGGSAGRRVVQTGVISGRDFKAGHEPVKIAMSLEEARAQIAVITSVVELIDSPTTPPSGKPPAPTGFRLVANQPLLTEAVLDWDDLPEGADHTTIYAGNKDAIHDGDFKILKVVKGPVSLATIYGLGTMKVRASHGPGDHPDPATEGPWTDALTFTLKGEPSPTPTPDPTPVPVPPAPPVPSGSAAWAPKIDGLAAGSPPPIPGFVDTPWNMYAGGRVEVAVVGSRRVVHFYLPPGQVRGGDGQRAEQCPALPFALVEGLEFYIGMSPVLNEDLGSASWQSIFQMKTKGAPDSGSGVMGINVGPSEFVLVDPYGGNGWAGGERHSLGLPPKGKSPRVVLGIFLHRTDGWVEAWRDGEQIKARAPWRARATVGPVKDQPWSTMYGGGIDENYLKFGPYRGISDRSLDLQLLDMRIDKTRAAVS